MSTLENTLQELFDVDEVLIVAATQYNKSGEELEGDGVVYQLSVLVKDGLPDCQVRQLITGGLNDMHYVASCNCMHDCCGHVFSAHYNTIIEAKRNIYGDDHLKDMKAFNVMYVHEYGYNY